jgi:acetyl-CoA C-acetyltransferase
MRMADRPQGDVILLPHEKASDYVGKRFKGGKLAYPGIHSFRAGRQASKEAYEMAKISDPKNDISFIELHDAYTSSEIQTYEDMGLCKYGDGGKFVESGAPFLKGVDYGLTFTDEPGQIPVNPSGGLLACGHPVGATGLMQAVFAFWQLQGRIKQHLGNRKLQVPGAERGLIHSHAGTGTYVTVSVLERRH